MIDEISKIKTVAQYTFYEMYKSRILLNVILLSVGIVFLSLIVSEISYGSQEKVLLDISLALISLSVNIVAVLFGAGLVSDEIDSRTIYMILSRPISRGSYLIGRIIGVSLMLLLNVVLLFIVSVGIYLILDGQFDKLIVYSIFFSFLEGVILLNLVVLFSLFTNKVISILNVIVIYVSGHVMFELLKIKTVQLNEALSQFLKAVNFFLPNLSSLNIRDFILYKHDLTFNYLMSTSFHSMIYILILVIISVKIMQRKNLD